MSPHSISRDDAALQAAVEDCSLPVGRFDHRAHVRLAYTYLVSNDAEVAHDLMRTALRRFLEHNGVDPLKYHETLTQAWILAVAHFMAAGPPAGSADEFIDANPELLDKAIMERHYSPDRMASAEARHSFVEPDVSPIPRHSS